MMTFIALVASLSLAQSPATDTVRPWFWQSPWVNGQTMRFMVTPEDMAVSPRWTEAERNPPLPARDALTEAQRLLVKLTPDASQFTFRSIELQPLPVSDVWVYLVKFVSPPQRVTKLRSADGTTVIGSILSNFVDVVVLMDGRAVMPTFGPA